MAYGNSSRGGRSASGRPRTPAVAVPVRAVSPALRAHPHARRSSRHRRAAQARAAQRASARRSLARRSSAQAAQVPAEAAAPNCPSANAAHRAAAPAPTFANRRIPRQQLRWPAPPPPPPQRPGECSEFYDHDGVRLQKLAQAGVASRRFAKK